jgi:two-component system, chemotaxis family, sensor kinase Cph1
MDHDKQFKLEQLADNINEVLWLTNISDGEEKVLYCSPAYEKIWGRPVSDLYNNSKSWTDSILDEYLITVEQAFEGVFESGHFEVEYQIRRPDGNIRWIRDRGWPVDGNIAGIAQDITEIKSIQQELKNFAYAASHDLREPLRIINGYAYMIETASESLPPTFKYYVEHIVNASKRMADMIDGLLSYSRVNREDKFKSVRLREIAALAAGNLQDIIKKTNTIIKINDMATVCGVRGQLIQVFQNLISNAIKFRKSGVIPRIEIGVKEKDDLRTILYIKDNGIGIKEENYKKAFQIFKKLHSNDEFTGRGIGLSLVKQIVEHHNGQIWLTSKIDEGTTFYFSLPTHCIGEKNETS